MRYASALIVMTLGLCAGCGDDPVGGGGSGGEGGIQDPATTAGSGAGSACAPPVDGPAICDFSRDNCEGTRKECEGKLHENRCTWPECTAAYDEVVACIMGYVDTGDVGICTGPGSCEDLYEAHDACVGDALRACGTGPTTDAYCAFFDACMPEGAGECLELYNRCNKGPGCLAAYDAWEACVVDLANSSEGWAICPDPPLPCDDLLQAWQDCPPGGP